MITDVKMPGLSGIEVLRHIKQQAPQLPVIVITAFGNVELAVQAMKDGAVDFIGKPFNRDHLLHAVARALEEQRLRSEVRTLRIQSTGVERPVIAQSTAMQRVLEVSDRVAASDASVLISGDSGTGKEVIARRIHVSSPRAEGPFVAVNCAALPDELLEAELFGHDKGAFTGAGRARLGRFRAANGGTLFLDEIGELPPALQAKLLRVLQGHVVDVLGRDEPVAVDVRIIAATNQDLRARVQARQFREVLLYRLNVVEIELPPLHARPDDIEPLARHFIEQLAAGRELLVPDALISELTRRPWRGNVRELQNACERVVLLCPGNELRIADLPPSRADAGSNEPATTATATLVDEWPELPEQGLSLVDLEKRLIERVLEKKNHNVSQASVYLGMPRHVLAYRMEKYGIQRKPA